MFQKILVGTDGSDTAEVAVAHAVELAQALDAELLVAHVYKPPRVGSGAIVGNTEAYAAEDVGRSILEHEQTKYGEFATIRTVLREGHPGDELIAIAEDAKVDLIVVGDKGMGMSGAKRLVAGSVANTVSHHAPTHLLIIHSSWAESATPRELAEGVPLYHRLLAGTDGSEGASRAVAVAAEVAEAVDAELLVATVGDGERGEEVVRKAAAAVKAPTVTTRVVEAGNPADGLLDLAETEDCDLIVVGNRGMTGARRFLGSVPNSISHGAGRNVLIVKTT